MKDDKGGTSQIIYASGTEVQDGDKTGKCQV